MALQGTLETFSVPEVLRLLANTAKTGMLALSGDRGKGKVWLAEGGIVAAASDEESGDIDAVLFDLLRFETGDFVFETDQEPAEAHDPVDVDKSLGRAEKMLEEWKEITSIVPSLQVGLRMVERIDGESVTVTASQWEALAAVGGGTTPAALRRRFALTEMDAYRRARDLVEAGLVEVGAEPEPEPVSEPAVVEEPAVVAPALSDDERSGLGTDLAGMVSRPAPEPEFALEPDVDPVEAPSSSPVAEDAWSTGDDAPSWDAEPEPAPEQSTHEATGTDEGDFLSQLSSLSPKAAAAVEATAEEAGGGESHDDLPADLADEAGDEEINRNLLLKFLSSTKN